MGKIKFTKNYPKVIIIGTSAGGIQTLKTLITSLKKEFCCPIIIVIHRLKNVKSHLAQVVQTFTNLNVFEAEEKQTIHDGCIYIAPANYHLMLEQDHSFTLTVDEAINFSRPSIDVSFVSFSEILKNSLIAIVLTGANADGAQGLQTVLKNNGEAWVQDPEQAFVSFMPKASIDHNPKATILTIEEMAVKLNNH